VLLSQQSSGVTDRQTDRQTETPDHCFTLTAIDATSTVMVCWAKVKFKVSVWT